MIGPQSSFVGTYRRGSGLKRYWKTHSCIRCFEKVNRVHWKSKSYSPNNMTPEANSQELVFQFLDFQELVFQPVFGLTKNFLVEQNFLVFKTSR